MAGMGACVGGDDGDGDGDATVGAGMGMSSTVDSGSPPTT
jgi:hypothetical protein